MFFSETTDLVTINSEKCRGMYCEGQPCKGACIYELIEESFYGECCKIKDPSGKCSKCGACIKVCQVGAIVCSMFKITSCSR